MSLERSYAEEHHVFQERNAMWTPSGYVYPDQDLYNFSAVYGHETDQFKQYVDLRLGGKSHDDAWYETTGWRPDQDARNFGQQHGVMRLWDYLAARDHGGSHEQASLFALREKSVPQAAS